MSKIDFKPNLIKIKQAILFCIEQNGDGINIYNLNKIFFEADKYHLNMYGRPVTGDVYIAMKNGTVPSKTRDMINSFKKEGHFIFSDEKFDKDLLSDSDIEALLKGFEKYAGLVFCEVENLNHEELSWKKTPLNQVIDFELMIENEDIKDYIQELGPLKIVV